MSANRLGCLQSDGLVFCWLLLLVPSMKGAPWSQ